MSLDSFQVKMTHLGWVHENRMRIIRKSGNICIGLSIFFGVLSLLSVNYSIILTMSLFPLIFAPLVLLAHWNPGKEWPWSKNTFNYED